MKKTAFILMLAMSLNFAFAQNHCKPMPDKNAPHPEKSQHQREPGSINPMMLKMKKDFIQENFIIESSKKEAFWNAYDAYERSIIDAHKAQREFRKTNNIPNRMNADSLSNLSDDAILKFYENNFTTKNLIFKAEEKFFNDMKNILTPQQIAQYYLLEKNFQTSAVKKSHPMPAKMDMKPMNKDLQHAAPAEKKAN
ncbi:MAG: hypothetical protein IJP72_07910 [Bacteroidales bacterium]|nr:hypothetical protein [Bacteroidales bacterium]